MAFWAAVLAAICAANGVDFREPLKPAPPDEAHEITFPCMSVRVMMVLLYVAWTKALPTGTTLFSFFRVLVFLPFTFYSLFRSWFLLAADGHAPFAFSGPRVVFRVLTAHRQAPPVTYAPVASDIHQPFYIHGDFSPQVTLYFCHFLNYLPNIIDLFVGKVLHPLVRINLRLPRGSFWMLTGRYRKYTLTRLQPFYYSANQRQLYVPYAPLGINTLMFFNGSHFLALLVPGIRAYNPHDAMSFYDLAFVAYFFYRNSYFHLAPRITRSVYSMILSFNQFFDR